MKTKSKLLTGAAAVLATVSSTAYAQTNNSFEPAVTPQDEVVVTGVRRSLKNAMDVKRQNSGVVDAISAEDIGKFPDTNLAESLQRITGVIALLERKEIRGLLISQIWHQKAFLAFKYIKPVAAMS